MSHKTSIGFKANSEGDEDIITWWETLPTGDRSRALRDLIRAAISNGGAYHNGNGQAPEMVQVAADIASLRSALVELPVFLEGFFSRMPMAHFEGQPFSAEGPPEEQLRLDQVAVDRRRANMKRSTW